MSISFNDLHDKLLQRVDNLISRNELYDWLDNNLEVKNYLPLTTKYAEIRIFSDKFKDDVDSNIDDKDVDFIYFVYDLNQLFVFLFAYTDIIVLSKNRTIENYDLIMKSGFFDYMMQYCKNDYESVIEKCNKVTGIEDVNIIKSFTMAIGSYPSVEEMERIRDIVNNEIDKDKLEIIKAVEEYNNPVMEKIAEVVKSDSLKEAVKEKE